MKKSILTLVVLLSAPFVSHAISLPPLDKKGTVEYKRLTREEGIAFFEKYAQQAMDGKKLTESPSERRARQEIDKLMDMYCYSAKRPCGELHGMLELIGKQMLILERMNNDMDARARDVSELVEQFRTQLSDNPLRGSKCVQKTVHDPYAQPDVTIECDSLRFNVQIDGRIFFERYDQIELK